MNKKNCISEFKDKYRIHHPELAGVNEHTDALSSTRMPSWAMSTPEAEATWRESRKICSRKRYRKHIEEYREYYAEHREHILLKTRDYARHNVLRTTIEGKYVILNVHKRQRPELCELCGKLSPSVVRSRKGILYYHHWDDNNPSKGLWLCLHCHIFAGRADKEMLVRKYLQLKGQIEEFTAS